MNGRKWIYPLVILLALLHQDFWLWDNPHLAFGFMPVGLAYHMFFSIAAALTWALAVRFAWPKLIEEDESAIPEETRDRA
jgi:hypothetical protein